MFEIEAFLTQDTVALTERTHQPREGDQEAIPSFDTTERKLILTPRNMKLISHVVISRAARVYSEMLYQFKFRAFCWVSVWQIAWTMRLLVALIGGGGGCARETCIP